MWVNDVEVASTDSFRVTMNNFLAAGGDGFTVFNEGTSALGGAQDIDAFVAAFSAARTGRNRSATPRPDSCRSVMGPSP
jgi:2',3'-cyclic-nucleotide 2'-phosphodiesterase (5'-nucleotidase family)